MVKIYLSPYLQQFIQTTSKSKIYYPEFIDYVKSKNKSENKNFFVIIMLLNNY